MQQIDEYNSQCEKCEKRVDKENLKEQFLRNKYYVDMLTNVIDIIGPILK
mgnify:CR=1 FL=1